MDTHTKWKCYFRFSNGYVVQSIRFSTSINDDDDESDNIDVTMVEMAPILK